MRIDPTLIPPSAVMVTATDPVSGRAVEAGPITAPDFARGPGTPVAVPGDDGWPRVEVRYADGTVDHPPQRRVE